MSMSVTGEKPISAEELAIVGLMEAIYHRADSGVVFIKSLDKLRSRSAVPGLFSGLNTLVPVKEKVNGLVGIIKSHVKKETIKHANAESRQSVSSIIKICTFQLKYLSNQIFVAPEPPMFQNTALISLFSRKKDILERVNFIDIQAKDLTRLLDYLNNVRPTPQPGPSISNPPTSLVPRAPCNDFVGRGRILEWLQKKMSTTGQIALDGPPGVGKSEICLQYAWTLQDKASTKWIFWIDGKDPTESPASAVLQWITKSKDESLIIVDDVDDLDSMEQSYYTSEKLLEAPNESPSEVSKRNDSKDLVFAVTTLPSSPFTSTSTLETTEITPRNRRGNLLISSKALIAQNKTMKKRHLHVERVPYFNVSEARKLLKDLIPKSLLSAESDCDDIIELVGSLPGPLKHAAKYIEDTGITTAQYLSGYEKQKMLEESYHTPKSSDDDVQIAAMRISKAFFNNGMFKSILDILHSAHVGNERIVKSVEAQLLEYSSDLERVWSKRAAQRNESENTLPAFIKEHHKRLSCLMVPRYLVAETDYFSFAPHRASSINSLESSASRRSTFSFRGISERISRQNSIAGERKQMIAPIVTLTDTVRTATKDESKNLERFYFHEGAFGRFLINVLHDLNAFNQIERKLPLFCQAEQISKLARIATQAWRLSHRITTVTYNVEWELPQVLDRDFSPNQHLSTVMVISGNADLAEAITCGEYIAKFWKHGTRLLEALSEAKCHWGRHERTKNNDGIEFHVPETQPKFEEATVDDEFEVCLPKTKPRLEAEVNGNIKFHVSKTEYQINRPHTLKVIVEGSEEVQSDIAQTLAWLAAAVRSSRLTKLHESRASMDFDINNGALNCTIKSLPLRPLVNFCKESSCWHALFTNSVLAIDYPPSKPRGSGQGLNISVDLLIALARTTIITELYKGFVIQGYQFVLVPVRNLTTERTGATCSNAIVQWHLIDTRSSDVSSTSLASKAESGIRSAAKNLEILRSFIEPGSRAFLGWCGKVNIHLGTDTSIVQNGAVIHQAPVIDGLSGYAHPYRDPRLHFLKSDARDAGRPINITTISSTAGGGGHGATASVGAAVAIGENREAAFVGRIGSLKETLQTRSKENIVLYDTATKRAWMVPYLNVVLHLVHLRELATTPNHKNSTVKMPFAAQHAGGSDGPAWDAIQPHLDLLDTENFNRNRLNRLNNHFTERELRFKIALRLAGHLEYLVTMIDAALKQNLAWRSKEMSLFHHSKIYGFEMEELSYAASLSYKEQKLNQTSGGWAKMRCNREQVFFCSGIGNLITPLITPESDCRLCLKCQSVPTGMDYLVAPVSCLSTCQHSSHSGGDDQNSHFKIQIKNSRFYEWKIGEEHFSNPCPHYDSHNSNEHQKTIHLSKSPQQSNLEDFSTYMEGAVIFGRRPRYGPLKSCGRAIKNWMARLTSRTRNTSPILLANTSSPLERPNVDEPLSEIILENELNQMIPSLRETAKDMATFEESQAQSRTSTSDSIILTHDIIQEPKPEISSIPAVPSQPGTEHMASNRRLGQDNLTLFTATEISYEQTQDTALSPSARNNDTSRETTPETPSPSDASRSGFRPDVEVDLRQFGAMLDVNDEGN